MPSASSAPPARIVDRREQGAGVVAVLSARGKTTDELIAMAEEVSAAPGPAGDGHAAVDRRADLLRAVRDGDQRSRSPRDFPDRLAGGDRDRRVAHQGADPRRAGRPHREGTRRGQHRARRRFPGRIEGRQNVTTLGRGGSDTSAVALAAALGADVCEIYTDVAGVSRPTRGSFPTPASSTPCPSRRCSRWRPRAPACCSCARSSTPVTMVCGSTVARHSRRGPVPL